MKYKSNNPKSCVKVNVYRETYSEPSQTSKTEFSEAVVLVQVFSCEFCEISKNTFFYRTPLVTVSEFLQ